MSGRLGSLDTAVWGYILLESAHDGDGKSLGLMHNLIPDAQLQKKIAERIGAVVRMGYQVRSLHEHEMSLAKLAEMINGIVRCAETIRDFYLYLATSPAQV